MKRKILIIAEKCRLKIALKLWSQICKKKKRKKKGKGTPFRNNSEEIYQNFHSD